MANETLMSVTMKRKHNMDSACKRDKKLAELRDRLDFDEIEEKEHSWLREKWRWIDEFPGRDGRDQDFVDYLEGIIGYTQEHFNSQELADKFTAYDAINQMERAKKQTKKLIELLAMLAKMAGM